MAPYPTMPTTGLDLPKWDAGGRQVSASRYRDHDGTSGTGNGETAQLETPPNPGDGHVSTMLHTCHTRDVWGYPTNRFLAFDLSGCPSKQKHRRERLEGDLSPTGMSSGPEPGFWRATKRMKKQQHGVNTYAMELRRPADSLTAHVPAATSEAASGFIPASQFEPRGRTQRGGLAVLLHCCCCWREAPATDNPGRDLENTGPVAERDSWLDIARGRSGKREPSATPSITAAAAQLSELPRKRQWEARL